MNLITGQIRFVSMEMDFTSAQTDTIGMKSREEEELLEETVKQLNDLTTEAEEPSSGVIGSVLTRGKKSYDWTKARIERSIISPICRPCFWFFENSLLPMAIRLGPTTSLKKFIIIVDSRLEKAKNRIQPRLSEAVDRLLAAFGLQFIYRSKEEIRILKENNKLLQSFYDERGVKIAYLENYNLEMLKDKQAGFELRDEQLALLMTQNTELQTSLQALLSDKTQLGNEFEIAKERLRQLDLLNKQYEASMRSAEEELMEVKQDDQQLRRNSIVLSELHEKEMEELKEKHRYEIESLNRELKLATDEIKATEEKAEQLTGTVVELLAQREIKENSYGSPNKSFKINRRSKRDSSSK